MSDDRQRCGRCLHILINAQRWRRFVRANPSMACAELSFADSADASSVAGELQRVRAKREALERANSLVSASAKQAALLRVQRLAEEAELLKRSLCSLGDSVRTSASTWGAGAGEALEATAQLHTQQARYFATVSRTLPVWREQTAAMLTAQPSRDHGTSTPDLFKSVADRHPEPQLQIGSGVPHVAEVRYSVS